MFRNRGPKFWPSNPSKPANIDSYNGILSSWGTFGTYHANRALACVPCIHSNEIDPTLLNYLEHSKWGSVAKWIAQGNLSDDVIEQTVKDAYSESLKTSSLNYDLQRLTEIQQNLRGNIKENAPYIAAIDRLKQAFSKVENMAIAYRA